MATINQRTLADGRTRYWVRWRLGGTRTGAPQSEPFGTHADAHTFKLHVEAAGHQWPENWTRRQGWAPGWIPGHGWVRTDEDDEPEAEPVLFADYACDGEYRREAPGGTTLATLPNPTEAIPDTSDVTGLGEDDSIVLAQGVVNSGEHSLEPDAEIWFHGWDSGDDPVVIDVSQIGIEDTEARLSTTAVPGAVVLDCAKSGDDGRQVLLGLT